MKLTAKRKREMQASGVTFGCYIDIDPTIDEPNGCVKDIGRDADCGYARRHRTREGCPEWVPIRAVLEKIEGEK